MGNSVSSIRSSELHGSVGSGGTARPSAPTQPHVRAFVSLYAGVLSAVAGFVNSVLLIALVYPVSHVSGSLSHSSMDAAYGRVEGLFSLIVVLASFFFGAVVAGAVLSGTEAETGRRYGLALVAESALLTVAALVGGAGHVSWATALAAVGCGLQNAMFSNYRGLVIRTTHMTGTFTDLGVLIGRSSHRDADLWKCALLLTTIAGFVVGGAAGAVSSGMWGTSALLIPAATCLALGVGYFGFHQYMRGQEQNPGQPLPADAGQSHPVRRTVSIR